MCQNKCCIATLGVLGVLGILMGSFTPFIFDSIVKSQLQVEPGSYSYDIWKDLPIPMYMSVYYFNLTNHEDVLLGEKPLLKQIGPYTFREDHHKHNITFFDDDRRVEFFQAKTWHFEPEMSAGTLDDTLITLNAIAYTAADQTRWPGTFGTDDYPFMRYMMNMAITMYNEPLFMTTNIENITFKGIDSEMLHMADNGIVDVDIPFERFGWFYDRNGSLEYDGRFEMWTGKDSIDKVGQITGWQDEADLSRLYPDQCSKLEGSAGEFFPPKRDKTAISYFTPDLCRPIFFNFKEETDFDGLSGYKYWLDSAFLANGTYNSSSSCYNPHPDLVKRPYTIDGIPDPDVQTIDGQVEIGLYNGLLNVSSCKFNSPAYVSFPHFYLADPALLEPFHKDSDLHPMEHLHASHLTLMPEPGVPLDVTIRMQINMLLRPLANVTIFENVDTMMFPMIWFETYTQLSDDMKSQLKFLQLAVNLKNPLMGVSIAIGSILLSAGLVTYWRRRRNCQYV